MDGVRRACVAALAGGLLAMPAVASTGYARMMHRLKAADATGNVRVVGIGRTVKGRTIPMAIIGPANARIRVLAICRQHGNEPISTEAALRLISRAAHGDAALTHVLNDTCLLVIPMLNADGAERGRRANARGVDLNRDWERLSQPESRAVARVFHRLRPQIVLDEHEWTAEDHIGTNSLESAGDSALCHAVRAGALDTARQERVPLRAFEMRSGTDMRLAHRHFARHGASAFLLETTPNQPLEGRLALYERLTARIGRLAANDAPEQVAPATVASLPPLFRVPQPATRRPEIPWDAVGAGALTLVLVLALGLPRRPKKQEERTASQRVPLSEINDLSDRLARRRAIAQARTANAE